MLGSNNSLMGEEFIFQFFLFTKLIIFFLNLKKFISIYEKFKKEKGEGNHSQKNYN